MANLRRLIDLYKIKPIYFPSTEMDGLDVVRYLETLPTVDAVEVVRCKDCKHWCTVEREPNYGSCSKLEDRYKEDCESSFDETTRFDDFCSYGERRTNG